MFGIKGIPCPSGAENVAEQIGSRLVEHGHRVTVYVRPHYTPRECCEHRGMRLVHLPSIPTKNFDAITHSFLASLVSMKEKPDIVHIHSMGSALFAPISELRGIKTVVQSHGLDYQRAKWGWFARTYLRMSDYFMVAFPSATTVVSRKLQRYYFERYKRKVHYIPNGVDAFEKVMPEEIHKLGLKGNDYILFAARLVPEKGCHYLVEAYKKLNNQSKKLIIAGDSSYGERYATELKKEGNENIRFIGFATGRLLKELYSNAYFFVLPSEVEGLSTALLEAMSYGNCILASDIEENCEAIGGNGFTFKSKNVDDLKLRMEYLLENENVVREYQEKACVHVRSHYNWDSVVDQYEQLYYSLIN